LNTRDQRGDFQIQVSMYNEGKKNTKYFLNLEKRHYKQGTITQLKINNKDFIQSDSVILSECKTYYKNLYSKKKRKLVISRKTSFHPHEKY